MAEMDDYFTLMRLHSPTGAILLMLPCWMGLALVSEEMPSFFMLTIFAIGSFVMRAAGCIINDMWDKDIDREVERTKNRPLANNRVSIKEALYLLLILLLIGFICLCFMGVNSIILGVIFIIPAMVYALMKRYFFMPQLFLGVVFGSGALISAASSEVGITLSSILLYIGCILWIFGYDTIYGCQDREDDEKLNLKSTAILFRGIESKLIFNIYRLTLFFWFSACAIERIPWICYSMFVPVTLLFFYQAKKVDFDNSTECFYAFKLNILVGFIMFGGLLIGKII